MAALINAVNFLNFGLLNEVVNINQRHHLRIERRRLRDHSDPFQMTSVEFIKLFRVPKDLARYLINLYRPFSLSQRSTAVPVELKVLAVLNFFGNGSYQRCVGHGFNIGLSQSTLSKILSSFTDFMINQLLNEWIIFSRTEAERTVVKEKFVQKFGFPGIIGAIDCTHIAIISPQEEDPHRPALAYYNRKGYYSINVQMICDADLIITNCNVRFPGSTHDSAIWSLSVVRRHLEEIFRNGELVNSWLIGDAGYPLQPWLLTPISNAAPGSQEERYNTVHIRSRNTIERCFGVLKQRFRCLLKHRTLHYDPVKSGKIILSCVIIHNMLRKRTLQEQVEEVEYDDYDIDNIHDAQRHNNVQRGEDDGWLQQGRIIRNTLIQNHFQ